MRPVVVAGIGQKLRGDDGAGLEAVSAWASEYPGTAWSGDVRVEIRELPGLELLEALAGCEAAVVVDAVRSSGAAPGAVHLLEEGDVHAFGPAASTAHGWGVEETLALGRRIGSSGLPSRVILIGIEAGRLEMGEGLSRPVKEALPRVTRLIQEQVERLLKS